MIRILTNPHSCGGEDKKTHTSELKQRLSLISVQGELRVSTLSGGAVWADGSQPYALGGKKFANNLGDVSLYRSSFISGYFYWVFKQGQKKWISTAVTVKITGTLDIDGTGIQV